MMVMETLDHRLNSSDYLAALKLSSQISISCDVPIAFDLGINLKP